MKRTPASAIPLGTRWCGAHPASRQGALKPSLGACAQAVGVNASCDTCRRAWKAHSCTKRSVRKEGHQNKRRVCASTFSVDGRYRGTTCARLGGPLCTFDGDLEKMHTAGDTAAHHPWLHSPRDRARMPGLLGGSYPRSMHNTDNTGSTRWVGYITPLVLTSKIFFSLCIHNVDASIRCSRATRITTRLLSLMTFK